MSTPLPPRAPAPRIGGLARAARTIGGIWAGAVVSALAAFATQLVVARGYGVEAVGILITSTAVASIVTPLALFGTHWFANDGRVIGDPARWNAPIRTVFVFAALVASAIAWVSADWLDLSPAARCMTVALMLNTVAVEKAIARFQVAGRFSSVAAVQPAAYLARLVGVGVAAALALALDSAWWLVALAQAGVFVAIGAWSRFLDSGPRSSAAASIGECLRELTPLVGIAAFAVAFSQIDRIFVSARIGQEAAGIYGAAASLLLFAEILPGAAANRFLLPRLGHADASGTAPSVSVERVALVALGAGLATAAAAVLVGPFVIVLLFGEAFAPAAALVAVLAWYLPGRFVSLALGPFFLARGRKNVKLALDALALAGLCLALWWSTRNGDLAVASRVKPVAETAIAVAVWLALRRGTR